MIAMAMKLPTYPIKEFDSIITIEKKYIDKTPYGKALYLIIFFKLNMKSEELVLINSNDKRCTLCDGNLKGSTWKNISLALEFKDEFKTKTRYRIIRYYCVRCMLTNKKRHVRTPEELDNFVDNLMFQRLRP